MSYGQYAGQQLFSIPTQYLRYVYANHAFTYNPELQRALEQYLGLPVDPQIRVGNTEAQAWTARGATGGANGAGEAPKAATPRGLVESRRVPQTGLDGFRAAFERVRREVVAEFSDDQDLVELMEETLGRVRRGLGI